MKKWEKELERQEKRNTKEIYNDELNNNQEIWKQIPNSNYLVSNFGNIKNIKTQKNIKKYIHQGRFYVKFRIKGGKAKAFNVARLVCIAFNENPFNKPEVNHIDGNKLNNKAGNLEWVTREENIRHGVKNNLIPPTRGEKSGKTKLKWEDIKFIREHYKPFDKEYSSVQLAKKFNISRSTLGYILSNKTWKEEWYEKSWKN